MKSLSNRKQLLIKGLTLVLLLGGCISDTEKYVQGYWYRGNVHVMN